MERGAREEVETQRERASERESERERSREIEGEILEGRESRPTEPGLYKDRSASWEKISG